MLAPTNRGHGMSLDQTAETLQAVLAAKPGSAHAPLTGFPGVTLYKVSGKMFAILTLKRTPNVILKCDPHLAEILREQYAGVGHRSHLDRRFWISVDLDADVPLAEIERLAAHSYDLVRAKLTKKQQAELAPS
ncbi:MAG: MmcQ/YjbR family DNA-binding protein [Phenylobacterium sp.]|nr:MAG: MmcQ/YjbR family DNA-binding protein [Phenylobacterium sp.]